MRNKILLTSLVFVVALQGCSIEGGTRTFQRQATVGQELIDLDRAYDNGIIDEDEYQRLRRKIIK